MIVFEEPGDEFELEKVKKKNLATKIRTIFFLLIFLLVIFFIVKNDFSFSFGEESVFEEICGPANSRHSVDDDESSLGRAKKAIISNQSFFKDLPNFQKIVAKKEPIGYKKKNVSIIAVFFNGEDKQHKNIPKELCGFQVKVVYK